MMQAAIDRVLRSFSFKPATPHADARPEDVSRDDAEALAVRLLGNYKNALAQRATQH